MNVRIVNPFAPFEPESPAHLKLGAFDWVDAIAMHRVTTRRSNGEDSVIITNETADLPGPLLRYPTRQAQLMLWILEVALLYLRSDDFDRDTVMMSPDTFCCADMKPFFTGDFDIGLLVREGEEWAKKPLLNAVQFWPVKSKVKLIAFYEKVMRIAETLPENQKRWGGDTTPIVQLILPIDLGLRERAGVTVKMIDARSLLVYASPWLKRPGKHPRPDGVVVDFKYQSKRNMRQFFEQEIL